MNVKELRIGNLVNYYLGTSMFQGKVTTITGTRVVVDGVTSKFMNLYGIEITEEWLLKFGLNKPINKHPYHFKKSMVEFLHNEYQDELKCFYSDVPMFSSPCKYVHQLQNLYFALTGEELTIKK